MKASESDARTEFGKYIYIYRLNNSESAENHIKKQALLEALFRTQIWNEPYVKQNPFMYISPRTRDSGCT